MNTTEKQKLEAIISTKLNNARRAYLSKRGDEHSALIDQLAANPPQRAVKVLEKYLATKAKGEAEVTALRDQLNKLCEANRKALNDIEAEAQKLGFVICRDYSKGDNAYRLSPDYDREQSLVSHQNGTEATAKAFDALSVEFQLAIWSEGKDMAETLKKFEDDIARLTV